MSKHQLAQHQGQTAGSEQQEPANRRPAAQPATAIVREMLASRNHDPKAIAAVISTHPAAASEIFALLHATAGNRLASQVASLVTTSDLGPPRDVVSFDQTSEYTESRATIDKPRHEVEPVDMSSDYMESRATIEGPAPWVIKAQHYNRAHADNMSLFLQATGTQCVDEATGEADPRKVARWQADHGIPPDGRIGDQTIVAAFLAA